MKVINKVLTQEAARERIVIVDCPPGHSMSTLAAIRSSDIVLCPMTLDTFTFWGKKLFSDYIQRRTRRDIQRRFVVTRYVRGEGRMLFARLREEREMLLLGGNDPAVFSERSAVSKALQERADASRSDRPKLKELHRIYGSECGDQLRKIVNAIALQGSKPA
jgi:cellulose biosynthesis protein BcsQ